MHCHQRCPDAGGEHRRHCARYGTFRSLTEPQPEPSCKRSRLLRQRLAQGSCTSISLCFSETQPSSSPSALPQGAKTTRERCKHQIGQNASGMAGHTGLMALWHGWSGRHAAAALGSCLLQRKVTGPHSLPVSPVAPHLSLVLSLRPCGAW